MIYAFVSVRDRLDPFKPPKPQKMFTELLIYFQALFVFKGVEVISDANEDINHQ